MDWRSGSLQGPHRNTVYQLCGGVLDLQFHGYVVIFAGRLVTSRRSKWGRTLSKVCSDVIFSCPPLAIFSISRVFTIHNLANIWRGSQLRQSAPSWTRTWNFRILDYLDGEWEAYRSHPFQVGISLLQHMDILIWGSHLFNGRIATFESYENITSCIESLPYADLSAHLWSWEVPLKIYASLG